MAHQTYSVTLDGATQLKDAGLVAVTAAGTVASVAAYVDLGSATAFSKFAIVVDWSACEVASGDELYTMIIEGSTTSAFSGTPYRLVDYAFGDTSTTGHPFDTSPSGRKLIYGDNVVITSASDGNSVATMQFIRVRMVVAGTVATGMNYAAWFVPIP